MAAVTHEVVGREAELAEIDAFLEDADALPGALLLEGEAGIGKTTLWRHGVAAAAQHGYRVRSCSPSESEQLSFTAAGDLLANVAEEALAALPSPQRRALATALLLEDASGPPPDQRAVALAFFGSLRALAAAGPLVVAVDDVQWLDRSSALLLEFAARRVREEPIGFLLARRSRPGGRPPLGLDRALSGRVQQLEVGPLSLGALHRLIRTRLGVPLARPALRRLREASGGNPFYALEIARALERRAGRLEPGQPLPVPNSLQELVRDRLAALPAETQEVLLAASALSEPTVGLVESATKHSWDALRIAVEAQVIELDEERIRFTHPLLASTTYTDADLGRRREIHRRLATVVADTEERARHLALSATAPSEEIASDLERAAHRARARGAPDAAAELAEKAASLTPAGLEEERRRREIATAEYRFLAGDASGAQALLEREIAELGPGAERARALLRLAGMRHPTRGGETAVEACERALAEPIDDTTLEAEIHTSLAYFADHDNPGRVAHARRALELLEAQPAADPGLLASALVAYGLGEYYVGRGLHVDVFARAISLEAQAERPRAAWTAGSVLGQLLKYTDDYEGAREHLEAAYRSAQEDGDISSLPDLASHLSELELWTGDWERADRYAREASETAQLAEQEIFHALGSYSRALVDVHLGRVESARALAEESLAFGERGDPWVESISLWVLGFLELSLGEPVAVDRHLSRADEIGETIGLREPGQWRFHPDHIEALIALGRLDEARLRLERFEERGGTLDRAWALATGARCRGLLAAARGRCRIRLRRLRARARPA